jgi:hypothetical protein
MKKLAAVLVVFVVTVVAFRLAQWHTAPRVGERIFTIKQLENGDIDWIKVVYIGKINDESMWPFLGGLDKEFHHQDFYQIEREAWTLGVGPVPFMIGDKGVTLFEKVYLPSLEIGDECSDPQWYLAQVKDETHTVSEEAVLIAVDSSLLPWYFYYLGYLVLIPLVLFALLTIAFVVYEGSARLFKKPISRS